MKRSTKPKIDLAMALAAIAIAILFSLHIQYGDKEAEILLHNTQNQGL